MNCSYQLNRAACEKLFDQGSATAQNADCLMKYIRRLTYDCPVLPQRSIDFRFNQAYTVNVVKLLVQLLTSVSKFFARRIVL